MFYLTGNLPRHKALDNRLNMSACSLSVTHRSDALTGICSHRQGLHFKFNFCPDSCCTVAAQNWDASELCYTWGELKCLHMMSASASISLPSQITAENRAGTIFSKSIIIHFCKLLPYLNEIVCLSHVMNFEEPYMKPFEYSTWVWDMMRHNPTKRRPATILLLWIPPTCSH